MNNLHIKAGYYSLQSPPEPIGFWEIGNLKIAVYEQLEDFQIKNTELLLGWKYTDNNLAKGNNNEQQA